jgi:hypothetical protein
MITTEMITPRLAGKFGIFRRYFHLDEMPESAAKAMQGAYLAGADAAFRILAGASVLSQEDALTVWQDLKEEIRLMLPGVTPENPEPESPTIII